MDRPVVFWQSARRHRIGRARARFVMHTVQPARIERSADVDPQLCWRGPDDRGVWLEIIALDLPDEVVVIHVMPIHRGRVLT